MTRKRPDTKPDSSGAGKQSAGVDQTEFGRLVVDHKLATAEELKRCLELKTSSPPDQDKPLPQVLVEQGCITSAQRDRLLGQLEARRSKGQQIPGYQILDKLGKGSMATVYKARQLSLDRIVAIKVLPRRLSESPEFVDRFYREGKIAAKLNNQNIVQAIDVGEAGGFHYFVMEYVDGYTVDDVLVKDDLYSEPDALDIIIQIAEALLHAHQQGLIHRDVKPKNIMIAHDGLAKLADMGLARQVADTRQAHSEAGRAYGTPYYISPEQIRGQVHIDFRTDIYSLGATFYHMVTGTVPFDGPNPVAVMNKHLRRKLVPPDRRNADLSVGSAEIIEVMMAKDPKDRYESIDDLLVDLKAVRKEKPPIYAREKFNISMLANMEEQAEPLEEDLPESAAPEQNDTANANLRVILMIVALLLVLSVLVNIILLTT